MSCSWSIRCYLKHNNVVFTFGTGRMQHNDFNFIVFSIVMSFWCALYWSWQSEIILVETTLNGTQEEGDNATICLQWKFKDFVNLYTLTKNVKYVKQASNKLLLNKWKVSEWSKWDQKANYGWTHLKELVNEGREREAGQRKNPAFPMNWFIESILQIVECVLTGVRKRERTNCVVQIKSGKKIA